MFLRLCLEFLGSDESEKGIEEGERARGAREKMYYTKKLRTLRIYW